MRRVIVCGGRNYTKTDVVFRVLDRIARDGEFMLINGGASGADQRAREWASERGSPCATVHAQWDRLGKSAGPVRNSWMLALKPDMVIAFPGGRGTDDMTLKALHAGVATFAATDASELIIMALDDEGRAGCPF